MVEPINLPGNVREGGESMDGDESERKGGWREDKKATHKQLTWRWSHVGFHMHMRTHGTTQDADQSGRRHIANSSKSSKPYPAHAGPHISLY